MKPKNLDHLTADERETLDYLRRLTAQQQRHEGKLYADQFTELVAKVGRAHGLDTRAVKIAKERAEAILRVRRAGCGALLAL